MSNPDYPEGVKESDIDDIGEPRPYSYEDPLPQLTARQALDAGYFMARVLESGECAAIQPMLHTVGLFVGIDKNFYKTRYCYPDIMSASVALFNWDGHGDPPGNWIKQKGGVERSNPNYSPPEGE